MSTISDGEPNADESKLLAAGNDDEVRLASGSDVRSTRPPQPLAAFHSGKRWRKSRMKTQLACGAELALIPLIGLIWPRVHTWFRRCCRKEMNG